MEYESLRSLVGTCTECGKVVYRGDEAKTEPKLICKYCFERTEQAENEKRRQEKSSLKSRRKRGLWVAAIISTAVLIAGIGILFRSPVLLGGMIALALFIYCFTAQMFWDGIVFEIATGGGYVLRMPGVIFEFSPDGLLFLIAAKIFLGLVAGIVFVGSFLFCALLALLISPFSFIPALLRLNDEIARL